MIALMLTTLPPDSRPRAAPRYGAGGRIVGARAHHSRAYSVWKATAAAEARACWAGRPALEGPVAVTICAVLPPPKDARPMGGAPRRWAPRKPDVDNVAKGVMDALTDAGVWADDAQVVALTVRRFWGAVMPRERGAEPVVELGGIEIFVGPADDAGGED